ncbi:MAG: chromosome segregation protein SMC [Pirellulales bacterium]
MLVALELAGFKSFADKTRFDFPDGITVVVGPNGSGKSNVVDAIKWVLGAQSAKALRGKDMADVIFKGSAGSGRKPANSAEATLVFDNATRALPVDADQVQVTRRVYRSGDSDYLINGQVARLKDIKNLFRGTGVGVDAYSLIEQGKVDRMLQASPKDRRLIFEEAAGISRFNAKKIEAERRMQRVDQNMQRLKDIVDEVHSRLSSLKSQATKAQRYREMTNRLHEIRLKLGWTEYSDLQQKHQNTQQRLTQLQQQRESHSETLSSSRENAQAAELDLHQVAQRCQQVEMAMQDAFQRIAVARNQQQSLYQRITETEEESTRVQVRLQSLMSRVQQVSQELQTAQMEQAAAQSELEAAQTVATNNEVESVRLRSILNDRTQQYDTLRKEHVALLRFASEKAGEIAQQENLLAELLQAIQSTEHALTENQANETAARKSAERCANRLKEIHQQNQTTSSELEKAKAELESNRTLLAQHQEEAAILQGRLEGAAERLTILEELQQHLEGVDAGARHILKQKANNKDQVFQSVYGLVADVLQVDVKLAPMIDTALGASANALILKDGQLIDLARQGQLQVPGRLTMIRLDRIPTARFGEKVQLDGVAGVIGRADRMVRFRREVQPLVKYLLATTWLVETLEVALELGHFRGAGLRFVTADCQLIDADGTMTLGSLPSSGGLVSRRSEIENAQSEIAQCKQRFQKLQGEIERVQGRIQKLRPTVEQLETQAKSLAQEFALQQATAQNAVSKLDEIEQQAGQLSKSLTAQQERKTQIEPTIVAIQADAKVYQEKIEFLEAQLGNFEGTMRLHEENLAKASEANLAAKVDLARTEQRFTATTTTLAQCQRNFSERQMAVDEAHIEVGRLKARKQQAELDILNLTSQLAHDYIEAEVQENSLEGLAAEAKVLRDRRSAAAKQLEQITRTIDKLATQIEGCSQELSRHDEACQGLLQRYAEDYQISFEQLQAAEMVESKELSSLNSEASRLRHEISSVGEINMAALAELDELQQRYDSLHGQYQDLQSAKESLQRIIQKINGDSRRLFLETLEAIRQNFQKLYRKSFGGGEADIVLEAGVDVLECGIDIIATPPGKTALSNSLLSGGEKALTAVALLLAIFQYRPSPFCVLDEVDAPFDEANIGRFVSVLTEFLDWTKFIIITHSKKTMTAANTLYGVTMQESGVSKQVAVRFDDVNEKGEIISAKSSRKAA